MEKTAIDGIICGMMITPEWIAAEGHDETLRVWAMSGPEVLGQVEGDRSTPIADLVAGWAIPAPPRVMVADGPTMLRAVPCPPLGPATPETGAGMTLHRLPGLSQAAPSRDALTDGAARVAGIVQAHPDFDGVICLTGARSAWVSVSAGEVTDFRTFLTGEMLDLLGRHSSLAPLLAGPEIDGEVFDAALAQTLSRPEALAARLSALSVEPEGARARAAGALIGAELAAAKPWWLGRAVLVVGDGPLAELYVRALRHVGLAPPVVSGVDAGLAGLVAAWRKREEDA
ncbi:2-dehydro-3-deoxygalactonokinase [Falsirhodobacter halotolerans]|uniref:2-dehydro-3-deoxygalactonokinase n=1 Tax=Falsirhodobacter halotolerans TaxID=1146892 RepID=UPI001FD26568|nr:2-dehydro-3-deoxygalactonokinase [Falsirhodobacter halotolerans]MCJ8141103.1 2-dehydro-3-deoxygalactonokinase [Falsirhodobacter halotolerans]